MKNGDLHTRMKKYENVAKTHLVPRTPVIIRLDGRAFGTFTKGLKKPFCNIVTAAMQDTMKYLCENIQGCVLGYTQSDEISLVLIDYKKLDSNGWFDYSVQKMCSISASMATMAFNKFFHQYTEEYIDAIIALQDADTEKEYLDILYDKQYTAMFDARVFNIPKEEVCNCILWRQNDAIRNSIEAVGQAYFSSKELNRKSCKTIKEMLFSQKEVKWNDFPLHLQRGSCCIKVPNNNTGKSNWIIDNEIPIFKGDGRKYINDLVFIGEK